MREAAGLTLDEAAPRLDKTRSALSRLENAHSGADVHIVRSMMKLYDHHDPDLLQLVREARRPGWWKKFGIEDHGIVDAETEASSARVFSLANLPELLQTENYMRALFGGGTTRRTHGLENDVAARLHRQRRLVDDEFPLGLTAIIDEAALHRKVGGPEVMRGQLAHLAGGVNLDEVTIQVLPNELGVHAGMDGAFTILDFPDDPAMLYVAYPTGFLRTEDPAEVEKVELVFDRLRSEALSPQDSVALIERVVDGCHRAAERTENPLWTSGGVRRKHSRGAAETPVLAWMSRWAAWREALRTWC